MSGSHANRGNLSGQDGAANSPAVKRAEHHHEDQLKLLKESLAKEGEAAFSRWGLSMYYSLSDEDVESQREQMGVGPEDALDNYNRGCSKADHEEYDEAITLYGKALNLAPELAEASHNLALSYEKAGKTSEAVSQWKTYLSNLVDDEESEQIRQHLSDLSGS